jgi:ABC-2 type transport system permease protein
VSQPATLTWFARHELRLFWRDWFAMLTAGKRRREPVLLGVVLVFVAVIHLVAYFVVQPFAEAGITADKTTLVTVAASAFLSWTLMLSQAIESVTRAFYSRADLDLILSSPTSARRLFAVRMASIALGTTMLTTVLASPFINALAYFDGARWLAAYGLLVAMGAFATAVALVVTVFMLRALGPRRTRLVSQVVSAMVAAAFVIGVQAAAIFSTGNFSRITFLRSESVVALAPEPSSPLWLPAHAAMGDLGALAIVLGIALALLGLVMAVLSAKFEEHAATASTEAEPGGRKGRHLHGFRPATTMRALRRKELTLLRRDPWLLSQTLMQILYLLPPALLLWHSFDGGVSVLLVMVPVLVMASGQLAGGLAWISVSGEDAPDLVASAPVSARALIAAKIQAVLGSVAVVVTPILLALAIPEPRLAAAAAIGIAISATSGTMIQIWFRAQARRSTFRRRQIPSRLATLAEALSSILWAGAAALAAAGSWFALFIAVFALMTLAGAWAIRPREAYAA